MKINKEDLERIEDLFGEILDIISNEGVEIATNTFAFFNPVKLGRELEQIKHKIGKIHNCFLELYHENIRLFSSIKDFNKIPIKDLDAFVSGELGSFAIMMQEIIDEKKEKHKNAWKDVNIENLRNLLEDKSYEWRSHKNTILFEREKRLLVHIANYCYFLYSRLVEIDKD